MGHAFVERFMSQGYTVRVFNRSPDNIKDLEDSDAILCATADELISTSSTIILMLSDADAINNLLQLNRQADIPENLLEKTIIQTTQKQSQRLQQTQEKTDKLVADTKKQFEAIKATILKQLK